MFGVALATTNDRRGVVKGREKLVWPWFGLFVPLMGVFVAQRWRSGPEEMELEEEWTETEIVPIVGATKKHSNI